MHVVIYSAGFLPSYGGAEQYAYYIGRSLSSHCKVTILTRAMQGEKTIENVDGMQVIRLRPLFIPFYFFIMNVKDKVSVFHVNLGGYELALTWPIAKLFRVPTVLTFHGSQDSAQNETSKYAMINIQEKMSWFFILKLKWESIVSVDIYGRSFLIKKLHNSKKVGFIPLGIDTNRFHSSSDINKFIQTYRDKLVIFCPRRIDPKSGLQYLFHAITKLKKKYGNVVLLIAGRIEPNYESYLQYLEKLIADLDIKANIVFLGNVPHEDMHDLYSLARLVVMPSLAGGRSLAVQEAMACGKVVIAMNVGGIPEQITSGVNGILIPPRDSDALYQAMLDLLSNQELTKQIGERASASIQNSWDSGAMAYLKIYQNISRNH